MKYFLVNTLVITIYFIAKNLTYSLCVGGQTVIM
jgi:hypothetical protein